MFVFHRCSLVLLFFLLLSDSPAYGYEKKIGKHLIMRRSTERCHSNNINTKPELEIVPHNITPHLYFDSIPADIDTDYRIDNIPACLSLALHLQSLANEQAHPRLRVFSPERHLLRVVFPEATGSFYRGVELCLRNERGEFVDFDFTDTYYDMFATFPTLSHYCRTAVTAFNDEVLYFIDEALSSGGAMESQVYQASGGHWLRTPGSNGSTRLTLERLESLRVTVTPLRDVAFNNIPAPPLFSRGEERASQGHNPYRRQTALTYPCIEHSVVTMPLPFADQPSITPLINQESLSGSSFTYSQQGLLNTDQEEQDQDLESEMSNPQDGYGLLIFCICTALSAFILYYSWRN